MSTNQPNRQRRNSAAILLVAALAAAEIAPEEGLVTHVYHDIVGIPSYCYGETQNVIIGKTYTPQECVDLLAKRVPDYMIPIDKAIPGLPDHRLVAYTGTGYNLGAGFIHWRKSVNGKPVPGTSVAELEHAGKWQAACNRLLAFDKVKDKQINGKWTYKVSKGVHNRRVRENRLCLNGWPSLKKV